MVSGSSDGSDESCDSMDGAAVATGGATSHGRKSAILPSDTAARYCLDVTHCPHFDIYCDRCASEKPVSETTLLVNTVEIHLVLRINFL